MDKLICWFLVLSLMFIQIIWTAADQIIDEEDYQDLYSVEGRVFPLDIDSPKNWQSETKILVNGGEYIAFLKEDGSFIISNLPSGSFVVDVASPNYYYEPLRVEINNKGKYRARKVNYVQTAQVIQMPYPLRMKAITKLRFFQAREQWRVTDFLMSPMVLMMVLPLVLIMILPKMMNDPETKKEMEQLNNLTKYDMPEMSEVFTSFFSGGEKPKPRINAARANKKRQ